MMERKNPWHVVKVSDEPEHSYTKQIGCDWVCGKRSEELENGIHKNIITKYAKTSFIDPQVHEM